MFRDREGLDREIDVKFPWLPTRCNVCQGWGHKGTECKGGNIKILQRTEVTEDYTGFVEVPASVIAPQTTGGMLGLLKELESLPQGNTQHELDGTATKGIGQEDELRITLSDPTPEAFPATEIGSWERVNGRPCNEVEINTHGNSSFMEKSTTEYIVVSPSRFSPLMGIDEDDEEVEREEELEVEEGEITGVQGRPENDIRVPPASKKIYCKFES